MKPLNLDNRPCSPISSNCVIWQGPDIPCINLCSGDTVSDIVAKLAEELCTILDQLNVSNYDLSCLSLASCPPKDFQALIQLLINKVCSANNISVDDTRTTGTCPDCIVSVASCFVQGTQTTMQLLDYVQMIANKVCAQVTQITNIQNELITVNETLVDLQEQIDNIPTYTLPSIAVTCVLTPGTYPIDQVINALMNDATTGYCALLGSTGTPAQISNNVLYQCIADSDISLASIAAGTPQSFNAYYAGIWVANPALTSAPTVANAIKNIWTSICDIYTFLNNALINVQDTATIDLDYTSGVLTANVQDTGWVNLEGFGFYDTGAYPTMENIRPKVRRIGNTLHFKGQVMIPLTNGSGQTLQWGYKGSGPAVDTYFTQTAVAPATSGPNSVVLNPAGAIIFNQNNACIPTSVIGSLNLDSEYYHVTFGFRRTQIRSTPGDITSTILTTYGTLAITTDKKLVFSLTKDLEQSNLAQDAANSADTSHLNYIISHVQSGQQVPQFRTSTNTVHSSTATGTSENVVLDYDDTNLVYPFSCNANDEDELGGFLFVLDGLTAFLEPCNTTIGTSAVCP